MNIQGFFSAVYNTATSATSGVYGFGKNVLGKGYSACSSLAHKVGQIAGRYIPTTVSSTVQAYPKSFSFAAGFSASSITGAIIYQVFLKNRQDPN